MLEMRGEPDAVGICPSNRWCCDNEARIRTCTFGPDRRPRFARRRCNDCGWLFPVHAVLRSLRYRLSATAVSPPRSVSISPSQPTSIRFQRRPKIYQRFPAVSGIYPHQGTSRSFFIFDTFEHIYPEYHRRTQCQR